MRKPSSVQSRLEKSKQLIGKQANQLVTCYYSVIVNVIKLVSILATVDEEVPHLAVHDDVIVSGRLPL